MYLAAAGATEVGVGAPEHHRDGTAFSPKVAGLWRINPGAAADLRLPDITRPAGQFGGTTAWYPTPVIRYLSEDLDDTPEILEAYTWPGTTRRYLDQWYQVVRDARAAMLPGAGNGDPDAAAVLRAVKSVYTRMIGRFARVEDGKTQSPLYRPDWRLAIVSIANVNLLRRLNTVTGFYSTATDLVRYLAAHRFGETTLMTDASKRLMQQSLWQVGAEPDQHYGLGLALTRVGKRELIGHGGGYPGHITCSVADPHAGLAVSVLTNAIDGPAQSLTHALVKLIDLAGASPRPEPLSFDPGRFIGRFASLWGVIDIALLGGRLFRIHPTQADPTENAAELHIVDHDTLRVAGGDGYGSFGEQLTFTFTPDGEVAGVRGESQVSLVPLREFTVSEVVGAPHRQMRSPS